MQNNEWSVDFRWESSIDVNASQPIAIYIYIYIIHGIYALLVLEIYCANVNMFLKDSVVAPLPRGADSI